MRDVQREQEQRQEQQQAGAYSSVDPWVISQDTRAEIAFLAAVFAAQARGEPVLNAVGRVGHAEVAIGEAVLLLFDLPPGASLCPAFLRVYVADVDATLARGVAQGARVVTEPTEMFWGERVARMRDAQGHVWWLMERVALDAGEVARRTADPAYVAGMQYVQDSLTAELARDATD